MSRAPSGHRLPLSTHRPPSAESGWPAARAVFLPGGKLPAVGSVLKQPELAATLQRFAAAGPAALVKRAEGDEDLAQKVGQRPDIPAHLLQIAPSPPSDRRDNVAFSKIPDRHRLGP